MIPQCSNCGSQRDVVAVPVLERRATVTSPAEYIDVLICGACLEAPEPDLRAYEAIASAEYDAAYQREYDRWLHRTSANARAEIGGYL